MPTPIQRDSLTKGIEERYASQRAGGAYDAKTAGTATSDDFSNEFADGFTKGGLNTNLPKKDSFYVKGFDGRRYAPGGRK
jgi:hypothetical protein